jgi:multiple sugar transport system permease protein/raffinose/stachyose/melibiose transport system permease protein
MRKGRDQLKDKTQLNEVLMVLPSFFIVFIFLLLPVIMSFVLSFTNWKGISWRFDFVGFENYKAVISQKSFLRVIWNTLLITIIYVPILNILALILASIIYPMKRLSGNFIKASLFFPNLLSPTVVGFIWLLMFQYQNGVINKVLTTVGLKRVDWLGQAETVMPSISLSVLWFALGYFLVIYIAGMTTIPEELYECAEVEGAGAARKFFKITLPMLAPSILINVILSTIGVVGVFEQPMVMTNGGPGYLSETLGLQIYHYAYQLRIHGQALVTAVFMVLLALFLAFAEWLLLRKTEDIY